MNASRIFCRTQANGPLWRRLALAFILIHAALSVCPAATTVSAWGNNGDSQSTVPPGLTTAVAVAAGNLHSLALKSDQTVVGWGFNVFGQATPPPGLTNVVAISAGNSYSIGLKSNGTVTQWGSPPTLPGGLTNVMAIAAGWDHALALKSNGTVVVWGTTNVAPAGLTNVLAIAAGNGHSLALRSDGTVVAWGNNSFGKTNVPDGLTNVASIAAGKDHSLALRWDGTVVAWGNNSSGQTNVPSDLSNVVAIAAGGAHSLALKADGILAAWGDNTYGQASVNPIQAGFIAIAGGGSHSLSIRNDGTPVVQVSPLSQSVTISKDASFQVLAAGAQPVSVHWQHSGTNLAGATNSILMLTNIQPSDAGAYTAVVSNFFGSATSAAATLTPVGIVPFVTFQPQDTTNFCGDNAAFQVTADGTAPFSYQWKFEGTPITDATTTRLSLVNISTSQAGHYTVVVTNAYGSVTSAVAVLTVEVVQPTITSALTKAGKQGVGLSYLITAIHTPISYGASGLPPGLTLNPVNGLISGSPQESGTFGPTITAYNNCSSDTEILLLTIASSVPVITSGLTTNGTEQAAFSYQIRATDNPTGFGAQNLPIGLAVDPATGIISGTPTYPGEFDSTITASNVWGVGSATLHFSFTNKPIAGLSLANLTWNYSSPYLLDFFFTLKDDNDPTMGNSLLVDPRLLSATAFENGVPLSSESDVIITRATDKLFKSYLVLDFTESVASLSNGDTNNNGISDGVEAMIAGAQDYVNQQRPGNQVGVYEFHREDMDPSNVVALTTDKTLLNNAIGGIWTNQVQNFPAASRAWDALLMAITNMPPTTPPLTPPSDERHFVVLASDGFDESSFATTDDVVAAALARGVSIYCIGFGQTPDATTLQTISSATGGQYYDSQSLGSLPLAFDAVAKDVNGQYLLRWPTLKRSSTPFNPSFQITYQGLTAGTPAPTVITNYSTNAGPPIVITTNYMTNSFFPPYVPTQHTGNVTVGSLRLNPNTFVQPKTITLRASYVPRYIRQLRVHYRANWPTTTSLQSTNPGEILFGWSLSETNDGVGGKWLQLLSSNPNDLGTSIPFASLGALVQFSFRDIITMSNAFSLFAIDNSIYAGTGGQSFVMDTNPPPFTSFITNYPPLPHGTPVPWLISYGLGNSTNTWIAAELADPDGDGVPTWLEYLAGTNPTNAASKFVVRTVVQSALDSRNSVTFSTSTNRTYRLESSDDLLIWSTALDNIVGTGGDVTITDTRYLPGNHIFYRAVVR